MDEIDTQTSADAASAEVRVTGILLMEIVDALEARGALKREDIAGALLRCEFRAAMEDEYALENGAIIPLHAGTAKLTTDEWEKRFGLQPDIYTLRKANTDWTAEGGQGDSPLRPEQIIRLYDD